MPIDPTGSTSAPVNIFDDEYAAVKVEPEEERYTAEESTRIIIGHLLNQPADVAKNIKQELLDTTAQQVLGRHESECEISQYLRTRDSEGINVQDIQKALTAETLHKETQALSMVTNLPASQPSQETSTTPALCEVTTLAAEMQIPDQTSLPVVMEGTSQIAMVNPPVPEPAHSVTNATEQGISVSQVPNKPLHVVTDDTSQVAIVNPPTLEPAHSVTQVSVEQGILVSQAPKALHVVMPTSFDVDMPSKTKRKYASHQSEKTSESAAKPTCKVTPLIATPMQQKTEPTVATTRPDATDVTTEPIVSSTVRPGATALPVVTSTVTTAATSAMVQTSAAPISDSITQEVVPSLCVVTATTSHDDWTSHPPADSSSKYYNVMTAEGDDIIYLNHDDIIKCRCTVKLDRLSPGDILFICKTFKKSSGTQQSSSSLLEADMDESADLVPDKIKKKISNRPRKTLSASRLKAQTVISENRKGGKREPLQRTKALKIVKKAKPEQKAESARRDSDTDDTIIYDPADYNLPVPKQ